MRSPAEEARKAAAAKKKSASPPPPKRSAEPYTPPTLDQAQEAAKRLAKAAGLGPVAVGPASQPEEEHESQRLTKTPLSEKELERYRQMLLEKRAEVLGDLTETETEALASGGSGSLSHMPQHLADHGSDEADQTLALGIAESQRLLLKDIDDALQRIEDRTYGICELLGIPINTDRLDATPWARYSVEGARRLDEQKRQG